MKKYFCVLLIIFLVISSAGCGEKKVEIERPDITLEGNYAGGYASNQQYTKIDHKGVSATIYYDEHNRQFMGFCENNTSKTVENIVISILLNNGEEYGRTETFALEENEVTKILIKELGYTFNEWTFNLDSDSTKNRKDPPLIMVADRLQNGRLVNLDTGLMKIYEEFDVNKNEGVEYYGHVYAGRHQSYKLEDYGLLVEIQYIYENQALAGTITNTTDKTIYNYGLKVIYDGGDKTSTADVFAIKAGETNKIGFNSIDWEDFEIYRPEINLYGYMAGSISEPKIEIRDIF